MWRERQSFHLTENLRQNVVFSRETGEIGEALVEYQENCNQETEGRQCEWQKKLQMEMEAMVQSICGL